MNDFTFINLSRELLKWTKEDKKYFNPGKAKNQTVSQTLKYSEQKSSEVINSAAKFFKTNTPIYRKFEVGK